MPPYLRVVEPSAWAKASKISRCLSGGMPMPVSLTAKCRQTSSLRPATRCSTSHHHLAALGELDGVADQVDDDLPQPARVADQGVGHVRRRRGRPAPAPSCAARRASVFSVSPRLSRRRKSIGLQLELAGLDLGEVEDVVDHASAARRPTP